MGRTTTAAEGKWREMLDRQRASGLSVAAFCRRHGVCAASLYAWKRRLRSVAAAPPFVEAKVTGVPAAAEAAGVIEVCPRRVPKVHRAAAVPAARCARLLSQYCDKHYRKLFTPVHFCPPVRRGWSMKGRPSEARTTTSLGRRVPAARRDARQQGRCLTVARARRIRKSRRRLKLRADYMSSHETNETDFSLAARIPNN